MMIVSTL